MKCTYFDVCQQLIEQYQCGRCQWLIENLVVQVTGLYSHLNLLHNHTYLLRGWLTSGWCRTTWVSCVHCLIYTLIKAASWIKNQKSHFKRLHDAIKQFELRQLPVPDALCAPWFKYFCACIGSMLPIAFKPGFVLVIRLAPLTPIEFSTVTPIVFSRDGLLFCNWNVIYEWCVA